MVHTPTSLSPTLPSLADLQAGLQRITRLALADGDGGSDESLAIVAAMIGATSGLVGETATAGEGVHVLARHGAGAQVPVGAVIAHDALDRLSAGEPYALMPFAIDGAPGGVMWLAGRPGGFDALHDMLAPLATAIGELIACRRAAAALRAETARLERALARAAALQRASDALLADRPLAAMAEAVTDVAIEIAEADFAAVQVLDDSGAMLDAVVLRHFPAAAVFCGRVNLAADRAAALALAQAEHVAIDDLAAASARAWDGAMAEHYRANGIRAVLVTPMIAGSGRAIGILSTHWRQPHRAEPVVLGAIAALARRAADAIERQRLAAGREAAIADLRQRLRHVLATTRALVVRSGASKRDVEDYAIHLDARVGALARMQTALMRAGQSIDLDGILRDELLAQAVDQRVCALAGPEVALPARAAEWIALAVHELVTNALKFGAFAHEGGHLAIDWRRERRGADDWLVLDWRERGVAIADDTIVDGFGADLIRQRIAGELGGAGSMTLLPDGLLATIALPLRAPIADTMRDPFVPAPVRMP